MNILIEIVTMQINVPMYLNLIELILVILVIFFIVSLEMDNT
jgi:hypothetical protein